MTTVLIKSTDVTTNKVFTQQVNGTIEEVMGNFNKLFKGRKCGTTLKGFISERMVKVEFSYL